MPAAVDLNNLPPFPKRLPEKIRTIRERLGLTPDEIAPKVAIYGSGIASIDGLPTSSTGVPLI
jgi:hypothetical protein